MSPEQIWLSVAIAVIPALASIAAAIIASRYANRARAAEAETARLRAAEERLAQKKFQLYEPMLKGIGDMLLPGNSNKKALAAMPDFMNFATVWASDEALRAFFHFRIASNYDPPPQVLMRLMADFMVAARNDLNG
jgi:hypothetical protein